MSLNNPLLMDDRQESKTPRNEHSNKCGFHPFPQYISLYWYDILLDSHSISSEHYILM